MVLNQLTAVGKLLENVEEPDNRVQSSLHLEVLEGQLLPGRVKEVHSLWVQGRGMYMPHLSASNTYYSTLSLAIHQLLYVHELNTMLHFLRLVCDESIDWILMWLEPV